MLGKRNKKGRNGREIDKEIDPSIFALGTLNYGNNPSIRSSRN
jgi:hypothetical protein